MFRSIWCSSILGLTAACASTPGARPHDMSTAQHEREGQSQAAAAEADAAKYNSNAPVGNARCQPSAPGSEPCWTSITNPTADYLRSAEKHRIQAADHRAASAALREAESRACVGISPGNRDMSPFDHVDDIQSVEPLTEQVGKSDAEQIGGTTTGAQRTTGVLITLRAVPGMTAEWLQREVDCHLARNASLGHDVPEMPNCPLVPKGVRASVRSTGNGFAVAIRADSDSTAREILVRAQRLRSAHINSSVPNR